MTDVVLESIRTLVLLGLVAFLWQAGKSRFSLARQGWGTILAGFGLLLFASILDITDNYESLNRFVVIGDTETEAFLEKFVGFLGGFVLLAVGLVRWIPTVQQLSDEVAERTQAQETLRQERDNLETELAERTRDAELELAERQRAQAALRESEALHRQGAQMAHLGHWEWDDIGGNLLSCSEEYARIYGMSVDEALSTFTSFEADLELVHPEDRDRYEQAVREVDAQRREFQIEYRIITRSGAVRHVQELGEPALDEAGRLVRSIGTLQDITERKRAEEALRKARDELEVRVKERTIELRASETQFKQAARTARLGHWHFDLVANEYLSISEEYARLFGYTVEEILEHYRAPEQHLELVHPEDRARVLEAYQSTEGVEFDYRIVRRDGNVRHVRENCEHFLSETGNPIEAVGTLQDITELKEAQLEAEQANRAKSEFLSRMSHELRTPMNAILGFGQLLQSTPPRQFGEKQLEFVGHILGAGQHLLTLIDEVLDLARIESGRTQMFMEAVDPGEVLEECSKLTESLVEKHSVTLENRVAPGVVPAVWADRTRLKQVLLNLITNAVKYNRVEGRVTVCCEEARAGMLRISVSDTGLGIPEERIGDLFEPFSRLHEEQGGVEGTGIGLTITKRLMGLMGGKLGVESTPGEGSTFWVELGLDPAGAVVLVDGKTALADAGADLPTQIRGAG